VIRALGDLVDVAAIFPVPDLPILGNRGVTENSMIIND
jgi:hypothetical protein